MARMTGSGVVLERAFGGTLLVVAVGDRVRLANGRTGVAHCWTARGVAVRLDEPRRPTLDGIPIWAMDAGDGDISAVLPDPTPADHGTAVQ